MVEKKNKTEEQNREECVEYLKKEWNDKFHLLATIHLYNNSNKTKNYHVTMILAICG